MNYPTALRRALLSLALAVPLGLLPACAARREAPVSSVDVTTQQANVEDFIRSLYAKDSAKVQTLTGYPFYLNHQAILNYPEEWQRTLQELFLSAKASQISSLNVTQIAGRQLEIDKPQLWARLIQYGFDLRLFWLAEIQTGATGQAFKERVLILLDPKTGLVVGFIK